MHDHISDVPTAQHDCYHAPQHEFSGPEYNCGIVVTIIPYITTERLANGTCFGINTYVSSTASVLQSELIFRTFYRVHFKFKDLCVNISRGYLKFYNISRCNDFR
jgi:hypothetical protein